MSILKDQIRIHQRGKEITSQFVVEDVYNVPDNKSDIGRIVTGEGRIKIEDISPEDRYLKVKGKLQFKLLYVTDSGIPMLASMEGQLPIEEMVYVDDGAGMEYQVHVNRVHFMPHLIHSRKLEIKAVSELLLHWERTESEEVSVAIEENHKVFQKIHQADVLQFQESIRDIYRIREEMKLPGTKENIEKIIWQETALRRLDTKLSDGKLLLNGELQVFCIYQSQEEKMDWVEQNIPFEGSVTCQGAETGCYHHVYWELPEMNLETRMDEDGEFRVIGVDGALNLRILLYKEENRNVLEDIYSLEMQGETEEKRIFLEELVMQSHARYKLVERVPIPEIKEEILQICHTDGEVQVENMEMTKDGVQIDGILHIRFLYVKANDQAPFDVWSGMLPFSYLMECGEAELDMRYDVTCGIEQLSIELVANGEIEVKSYLGFLGFLRKPLAMKMISGVTWKPFEAKTHEKQPGIICYFVKNEDSLWGLAKKYGTTEESIMEINGLDSKILKTGEKLLILKENMSIL